VFRHRAVVGTRSPILDTEGLQVADRPVCASLSRMAAPSASQPTPQRLASIREQLSLLADYL
jgi:hypothetical protein